MSMPDIRLTGQQQQTLVDAQKQIAQLNDLIRRAEMAGLDVSKLKDQLAQADKLRAGLLTHFGTGSTS